MAKKKTLDDLMETNLNIKKDKGKIVQLPTGETVTIPKLSYKHFIKIKTLKTPDQILNYVVDEIKPRPLSTAETEFLLIHLYYHNNKEDAKILDEIGIDLSSMTITEQKLNHTFDNIRLEFNPATLEITDLELMIKKAYVDDKEIKLTDKSREELIQSLYRHEIDLLEQTVIQEVYLIHEGRKIKGLNIIGE
ncbi:baseplate distal hub subunit [Pectobacterium phage POP12]|nr:baseplate distal hub subunit [Pectobacterium phage POP12]